MSLLLLSLLAGGLTVLSPCVLPVLPFIFARPGSHRLFGGLGLGFAAVMLLATAGGAWAMQAHEAGRAAALALLAAFGLALAWPVLAERALRPMQSLAERLSPGTGKPGGRGADWLLGLSTGLLWAPCAGPVLGLVLTAAALQGGGGTDTALALLAYAAGATAALLAVRLAVARAGRKLPAALRASLPVAGAAKRLAGFAVLGGVVLVASGGADRLAVALPGLGLDRIEQHLLEGSAADRPAPTARETQPAKAWPAVLREAGLDAPPLFLRTAGKAALDLPVLGSMPPLAGATAWLNSPPLRSEDLRGKVVLVDFWTFGCINCQRALPSVRDWAARYRDQGLVVIGVHSPEFAFERDRRNVEQAQRRLGLDFPVAMDNDFAIWNAWSNRYWPALYLVDAQGRVRWQHFGEGAYADTEQAIRQLLDEARKGHPTS